MGEVYRATDTKLGREVAIKVLPTEVSQDPERLGRFQREAQLLAALNHPNVGAIYGLEEAEGKPFLVLELVEGEELQQRLERGAIPVDEAIEIARQIAGTAAYMSPEQARGRAVDRFAILDLPDTGNALYPAWSPDGSQLVRVRQGQAWKSPSDGGSGTALGAVPDDLGGSGGSVWTEDGRLVFAGSDTIGLWEIPVGGGEGREILELDREQETDCHELGLLPGNRGLLFTVHRRESSLPDSVELLADGSRRVILQIPGETLRYPVYSPSGHLVYERETTSPGIWAVPFSLERLETSGAPFLVVPGGRTPSIARDGTLCFVRPDDSPLELVRVSRSGAVEAVATLTGTSMPINTRAIPGTASSRSLIKLALSPDGGRLALMLADAESRLWVYDVSRGSLSSLATGVLGVSRPVWAPGGGRLFYSSSLGARTWNLTARRADAAGEPERLATSDDVQASLAVSPDGRWLVYSEGVGARGNLFKRPLDRPGDAEPLFPSRVAGFGASFSPAGRWLVYEDSGSERAEVYIRPFPEGSGRWRVSTSGGLSPLWHESGEIFYLGNDALHAVTVRARGDSLDVSKPTLLFRLDSESTLISAFDVMPDGQHFLMLRSSGQHQISLILNWPRELARLAAEQ